MKSRTAKYEWYSSRPFRFGGKGFEVGQPFPWKELECTQRRLDQLVAARRICRQEDLPKVEVELPSGE